MAILALSEKLPKWHFLTASCNWKKNVPNDFIRSAMKGPCFDFIQNMSLAPSKCLPERINWIIPHEISKILFVWGSYETQEMLECKIRASSSFRVQSGKITVWAVSLVLKYIPDLPNGHSESFSINFASLRIFKGHLFQKQETGRYFLLKHGTYSREVSNSSLRSTNQFQNYEFWIFTISYNQPYCFWRKKEQNNKQTIHVKVVLKLVKNSGNFGFVVSEFVVG